MPPTTIRPSPPLYTARSLLEAVQAQATNTNGLSAHAQVGLELGADRPPLHVTRWHYLQHLHAPWTLTVEASSPTALASDLTALVWQTACFWQRDGSAGHHSLTGPIQRITLIGRSADLFHYRLTVTSSLQTLAYTRQSRTYQRSTCVDVAQAVLAEHGIHPLELRQIPPLALWRHLSQHRDADAPEQFETDLHFIRRVLATEGLALWLEPDEAGERLVIGPAGLAARPARDQPLATATPGGLNAPEASAEHLLDFARHLRLTPGIARAIAYDYRSRGAALSAENVVDPRRRDDGAGFVYEEFVPNTDALIFDSGDADADIMAGVQSWLQRQAELQGQRMRQTADSLSASSNAAGLWRCGQTVRLQFPAFPVYAKMATLWLLTRIEAGSHLGPALPVDPAQAAAPPSATEPGASQAYVHFEASPLDRWLQHGWAPEALKTAPLDLEHARVGATPGSNYAYLDQHGRYQLELNADQNRPDAPPGGTSRPARHLRHHAGADYGWHLPLHEATEVLVAFHGGHADAPLIAGALHDSSRPDPVTGINASRNVLRTWGNNKFRLEDRQGEEHLKLATEHGLAQLNLGHHVDAERVPRGEGWELRTDQWGVVRASQGLLVSTFKGDPRGGLGGASSQSPAHQRFNPGTQDVQGAQALAEQRSEANQQVGLGELDALKDAQRVGEQSMDFGAPLLQFASAEHLMHLTAGSQQFSANTVMLAAQGSVELASAEQIRLYAKGGIGWHTEGAQPSGAGQGGARVDVISHGSDEAQALDGKATILAEGDVVLEFRGEKATLSTGGVTVELLQTGELAFTANVEMVSEAAAHQLGGALDWRSGSGVAGEGPLAFWGKMDVRDDEPKLKFELLLSNVPGPHGLPLPFTDWRMVVASDAEAALAADVDLLVGKSNANGKLQLSGADQDTLDRAWANNAGQIWLIHGRQVRQLQVAVDKAKWTDGEMQAHSMDAHGYTDALGMADNKILGDFHQELAKMETELTTPQAMLDELKKGQS